MIEQPKTSPIDAAWEKAFIEMCKGGCDPAACADAMLRIGALRVEHLRGSRVAAATLAAMAGYFAERGKAAAADDGSARH
jgi:hypothetical protein